MRIVLTSLLLAASAGLTGWSVAALPMYNDKTGEVEPLLVATAVLWVLFATSLILLRSVPVRAAVVLVVAGSVAIGGAAMFGPPNTSTDSARYAWDGIVQNAGISPYEYVPADPALTDLRTDWLFPDAVVGADGEPACASGPRVITTTEVGTGELLCTTINRPTVPTIYPPTSELYFAGLRALTGPSPEYWPSQLAGLIMSLGITLLLLRALRARGLDPRWAAMWGFSPLAATEGVTNSHVDLLGALLLLVATLAVSSGRRWAGGAALGAAIATKLIPVIGAPALLGRRPWRVVFASVGVFFALYIPYVALSGIEVLGYLPGYLTEEGYETGSRFILVSLIAPGLAATILVAIILVVTAVLVWRNTDPTNPWLGQLVMIGVTLLAVTPRYPWYALILVPMIAMTGRWEWLAVPLALTERLLVPSLELAQVTVAIAVVVVIVCSLRRAGPDARTTIRGFLRNPLALEGRKVTER